MRTVKEVSQRTGISVRTLHYYDEIGLLKPTKISEAGYRLYDDKALEILQQILFFREFDIPLREIRAILENPQLDKNQLLQEQKKLLVLKKERLERMISSIDDILKGDNKMDFAVFDREDMEQLYRALTDHMSEQNRELFVKEYGSMEAFERQFMEHASGEQVQKNMAKVVEWYGDKESAMAAGTNPNNSAIYQAYANRYQAIIKKLAAKVGADVSSFEVKEIVGELDFVTKQLYQLKDAAVFMRDMADMYLTNGEVQRAQDAEYGEGSTVFIGEAIKAFYAL